MVGQRGRTRPGRLDRLDAWLIATEGARLTGRTVVDLGLGDTPDTTVALADRLAPHGAIVVGVDHEPDRVAVARQLAPGIRFEVGGFALPVRQVAVVRAMNVLRGYPTAEVPAAHRAMLDAIAPGGLLIEGSTDTDGHVLVAHLIRRTADGAAREGLWMSTDGRRGFAPWMLRDWLPRDLRRTVIPGSALHDLFRRWTDAWEQVRADGIGDPRLAFARSAERLPDLDVARAHEGDVVWRPPVAEVVFAPR